MSSFLWSGLAKSFGSTSDVNEQDLDDFAQDAIVRVLNSLTSFRGESRFTTWAMTIALRVGHTALRRRRSGHLSLEDIDETALTDGWTSWKAVQADVELERGDLLDALQRSIFVHLTEKQRTVIIAELQGVTSERMADLLGTNRNAVYKLYHDARKKLRRALNEQGFTDQDVRKHLGDSA